MKLKLFLLIALSFTKLYSATDYLAIAKKTLLDDFNIQHLTVKIGNQNVTEQISKFSKRDNFISSFKFAMQCILQNNDDAESPINIVYDLAYGELAAEGSSTSPENVKKRAQKLLLQFLDTKSSSLILLHRDSAGKLNEYGPEYGEKIKNNWIFVLYLTDLSDHIFWSIVSRNSEAQSCNVYGFN